MEPVTVGLDPEWVGQAMADAVGETPSVRFVSLIGTGQMSRMARYDLDWPGGDGPASVVVKLPSSVETTRSMSFRRFPYLKECNFYQAVASEIDVAVPEVFHVHYDGDGQDFAIIQENVETHDPGDQLGETPLPDVEAALHQAAALHTGCWGRTDEARFDVYREDPEKEAARAERTFPAMAEEVLGRWGDRIDGDVLELVEGLLPVIGPWRVRRARPDTLVHGDFRPDNMLFDHRPDADGSRAVVAVDWQLATVGLSAIDVAFLIGGALSDQDRAAHEPDLLATYRGAMADRGVALEDNQFGEDYALATLHGVVVALSAAAMVDRTERGEDLLSTMLNRHGRHALAWSPLNLL